MATKDGAGVYFVNGGELYKGTQRFGLGRVTVDANFVPSTSTKDGQARGDIVVTGSGAGWVYVDSTNGWKPIGGDTSDLQSAWQADISTWTSGLVSGGEGSYITGITQDADGKVTASAAAFPTLATGTTDGTLKLGSGNDAKVSGWDTVKTDISNLQAVVSYSGSGDSVVTATTGSFTNLTVTSTATFSATTVSADTLTVGGTQVNNIAASSKTGGTEGVAVTVSTARGGVTDVGVAITSATLLDTLGLTDFSGKDVVTAIGPSSGTGAATDNQVPTALAVAKKLATLDNAMHFLGVGTVTRNTQTGAITVTPPAGTTPAKGDIVIDSTSGLEAICTNATGPTWELIGDNALYALNAYSSTASVYTGVDTVPEALDAVGAAADTFQAALDAKVTGVSQVSDTGNASNLVTAGAVTNYVSQEIGKLGTAANKDFATTVTSSGADLPT